MAPKRRSPKAKAKARSVSLGISNERRGQRQAALRLLNGIAEDASLGTEPLDPRNPDTDHLEKNLRLLNRRCTVNPLHDRFDAAVRQFVNNSGKLPDGMTLAPQLPSGAAAGAILTDGLGQPIHGDADAAPQVPRHKILKTGFRSKSKAFMLTHNSRSFTRATWDTYRCWARSLCDFFGAKAWSACLELSEHASGAAVAQTQVFHAHSYFFWEDGVGIRLQDLSPLKFDDVRPRVDRCIQVANGRCPRTAALHGLWYVWIKKSGTVDSDTNFRAWFDYQPLKPWLTGLYDSGKLTHERFLTLSCEFRSGHAKRKRDAIEVSRDELEEAIDEHVRKELEALEVEDPLQDFQDFEVLNEYVDSFRVAKRRRPVLVIIGETNAGKSLVAAKVLQRVGEVLGLTSYVEVTVEDDDALDFSKLDVRRDAGALLDGVADAKTIKRHREILQGRPKKCRGGRSATMVYSYPFTLCRRAAVVTMDLSARNLELFVTDHWLSNPKNCLVLRLTAPAWVGAAQRPPVSARTRMSSWSCQELQDYLHAHDMAGLADQLYAQSVNGADFLDLTEVEFVEELRISPFAAKKLIIARNHFVNA